MAAPLSPNSATRSLPPELDLQMLCEAQACLRCLHAHETPSPAQVRAFDCLHATYDPVIRNFVLGYGVSADDADDVSQDVWQYLYLNLKSFQSDGTQRLICSWLKTIAHSKALDFFRYKARRPSMRLRPETEAELVSNDPGPEVELDRKGRKDAIQVVLAMLSQRTSELTYRAFYLHWMESYRVAEIASQLNLSGSRIRSRLHKARKKFRYLCEQAGLKDLE